MSKSHRQNRQYRVPVDDLTRGESYEFTVLGDESPIFGQFRGVILRPRRPMIITVREFGFGGVVTAIPLTELIEIRLLESPG